jgi:hypothetical protein
VVINFVGASKQVFGRLLGVVKHWREREREVGRNVLYFLQAKYTMNIEDEGGNLNIY